MTKEQLIAQIAQDANCSKAQGKRALESFINSVNNSLKGGNRVSLAGFGSFSVSRRNARTGRNPKTGAPVEIPAKTVARFKAAKLLNESLNR